MLHQKADYSSPGDNQDVSIKRDRQKTLLLKKDEIVVQGKGTDVANTKALINRAKRKTSNQLLLLQLIEVAKKKGRPKEFIASYRNAYYCQTEIVRTGDRLHGKYCKNRICTICNCIRKAEEINKYLPVIKTWPQPYMVVLTSLAVPAKWLIGRVVNTLRAFKIIIQKYRKRNQRGNGIRLMGIRSLECNFNSRRRTYNVHFHLLVPTQEIAHILRKEWLKLWKLKHASDEHQFVRPVKDSIKGLIEVIKYNTKIFTDPEMKGRGKAKCSPKVYVRAMDNIIFAMKNHRIFDRFGFDLPKVEMQKGGTQTNVTDYATLKFTMKGCDWFDVKTGEALTGYEFTPKLKAIWENNIDTVLE